MPAAKGICNIQIQGLPFGCIQRIQTTSRWTGARQQVGGAVIGTVRRKQSGLDLAEDLFEAMVLWWDIGEIRRWDGTDYRPRSGGLLQADSMTGRAPPQDGPSCLVQLN